MIVYTVMRHLHGQLIPLHSFDSPERAENWAELQMKYLDKDYFYSIAIWDTSWATVIECKDKRLRLVK